MSGSQDNSKPKGIIKNEDNTERRVRKTISFNDLAEVVVYNQESSPSKQAEPRSQVLPSTHSVPQVSISNAPRPPEVKEYELLKQGRDSFGRVKPKAEPQPEKGASVVEDVPDRNEQIRKRLEKISRRRSVAASLNHSIPVQTIECPEQKAPVVVQVREEPRQQLPGKRLSDAFKRGLKSERLTMNDDDSRRVQKDFCELDDNPSNNKRRQEEMKLSMKQRHTINIRELEEMLARDVSAEKSPQREERKNGEAMERIISKNRVTMGMNELASMLQDDNRHERSYEKSPSFKKVDDPTLIKYADPVAVGLRSAHKPLTGDLDYGQKRLRVIAFLEEMKNCRNTSLELRSFTGANKEQLAAKRQALLNRIGALQSQNQAAEQKIKHLNESIKQTKSQLAELVPQMDTSKVLNLLLGIDHLYFYPEEKLRSIALSGESIEYYVQLSFNHEIYVKIKKRTGKQPQIRVTNSVLSDQQTGVLCAKVVSSIIKTHFAKNCAARRMIDAVVFVRNHYLSLKQLKEQLILVGDLSDLRSATLNSTLDQLTVVIASRRNDAELNVRIDVHDSCWWKHVSITIIGYQEQAHVLQSSCRLTPNYLSDLVMLLSKKVI